MTPWVEGRLMSRISLTPGAEVRCQLGRAGALYGEIAPASGEAVHALRVLYVPWHYDASVRGENVRSSCADTGANRSSGCEPTDFQAAPAS